MDIDVEGFDYEILKYANFGNGNGPEIILVEVSRQETNVFISLMTSKGYTSLFRIQSNIIFVRNDLCDEFGINVPVRDIKEYKRFNNPITRFLIATEEYGFLSAIKGTFNNK